MGDLPPYFDPRVFQFKDFFKEGDVLANCAIKSGTHWTMYLTWLIRHKMKPLPTGEGEGLYTVVPWLEYIFFPNEPESEWRARLEKAPSPRTFKSHMPCPPVPIDEPKLKHIIVVRNVYDVTSSVQPFFGQHTDEFKAQWGGFPPPMESFDEALGFIMGSKIAWNFFNSWYSHRHHECVLLMHFNDMKKDLAGCVRKMAAFLGVTLSDDEVARVAHLGSFAEMKKIDGQIENLMYGKPGEHKHVLQPHSVMRKGAVKDKADMDNWTEERRAALAAAEAAAVPDEAARKWLNEGGPLPP